MTQQSGLDVLFLERFLQERVFLQVKHAQTEVHGSIQIPGQLVQLIFLQWLTRDGGASLVVDRPIALSFREGTMGRLGRHGAEIGWIDSF